MVNESYPQAKRRAYSHIPNNGISPDNPYTILIIHGGYNSRTFALRVIKTNGKKRPKKIYKRDCIVWTMGGYLGVTNESSFYSAASTAVVMRDFHNMVHRISLGKQRITPEIMASVTDPDLRQKLVEAICRAAIR